jgi:hypothetical protein
LLNRRTGNTVPWVRIPLSPQTDLLVINHSQFFTLLYSVD